MIPSARISAAIEVLADIAARRRPVSDALKDWGLSHRFAGSKDRAAIASLVYDALRRRSSAAWVMGDDSARAVMIGALALQRGLTPSAIASLFSGERFAPEPLTEPERAALENASLADAPAHVAGDFPEWLEEQFAAFFGEALVPEMQALCARAPLDIRANTHKTTRAALQDRLAHLSPIETPLAPHGLRVPIGEDGRGPSLQSEPEFIKGLFEIQDEGSQLAALLCAAKPGEQVIDLCAGAGGKTLALAAMMENQGQIFATDTDKRRLAPIHDRLARSGAHNVQVRTPRGADDPLADLAGKADCVLVDAPCTGSGTWRRNPDAKWRLRPGSLAVREAEQAQVLDRAAGLARPGGRVFYITCSILPAENDDAVSGFLARHPEFTATPVAALLAAHGCGALEGKARTTAHGLQMTPLFTGTDGFYVAGLTRAA
ncbi:MAG: RsmB/NOP family class I SAM-dependent RNA methyltransferase [Salinarimonadaceae bacterium]|nr:MAG: RsmB/NOP family class I SAM-dependent RNA methyltransferase [Salinarimonadaceae bacterium]